MKTSIEWSGIKKKINQHVKENRQKIENNARESFDKVATEKAARIAKGFADSLDKTAQSMLTDRPTSGLGVCGVALVKNVADAIRSDANSVTLNGSVGVSVSYIGGSDYLTTIDFKGDFKRESVAPNKWPEGVDNILVLLNNGYSANNRLWGSWKSKTLGGGTQRIQTISQREGAQFVQGAISSFQSEFSAKYKISLVWHDAIYGA